MFGTTIASLPPQYRDLQNLQMPGSTAASLPPMYRDLQNLQMPAMYGTTIASLPPQYRDLQNLRTTYNTVHNEHLTDTTHNNNWYTDILKKYKNTDIQTDVDGDDVGRNNYKFGTNTNSGYEHFGLQNLKMGW